MKKIMLAAGALMLLCGSRGQAAETKDYDEAIKEIIAVFSDGTKLKTIKDEETAKKAGDDLKKVGEKIKSVQKKFQKLGKPTKDQEAELKKKHEKEMKAAQTSFIKETQRVAKVPGGKEALEALMGK